MDGEILYLSQTYPGSIHDKKICDIEEFEITKKVDMLVDLGFLGLSSQMAKILIPIKNKKKQKLNQEQKDYNKFVSKLRVKIEHIIGNIKINRKVKEKFRGRMYAREDVVMLVACSLHNLKVKVTNVALNPYSI